MNEMEQRARMRNLDDLAKEMDRYEADQFRGRGKQQPAAVVAVEEKHVIPMEGEPKPSPTPQQGMRPSREINPTGNDRPMYQDPPKQDLLNKVEADSSEAVRKALMSRGQFGQSRKG